MFLRTRHLACFLLLLSTLGAAQASASPTGRAGFRGSYIDVLLYKSAADAQSQHHTSRFAATRTTEAVAATLPRTTLRTPWTMRPAAAHAVAVHAATSFARA